MRYHHRPAHTNGNEHVREDDRLTATDARKALALARNIQRHGEDDAPQNVTIGILERHMRAGSGASTALQPDSLTPLPSRPTSNPRSARHLEVDNARSICACAKDTEQLALRDLGRAQVPSFRSSGLLGYGPA